MTDIKTLLEKYRKDILQIELCGLLHDIGKLSKDFIDYRQTWHTMKTGWNDDPHPLMLERDLATGIISKSDKEIFAALLIDKTVRHHEDIDKVSNKAEHYFIQKIKVADSIDAAQDRNNPLFSCEQITDRKEKDVNKLCREQVFKANVYGYEEPVCRNNLNEERKALYQYLGNNINEYFTAKRSNILKEINQAFSKSLSDTTRPDNDTTLWDHAYAVASLAKVFKAHEVIYDIDVCPWKFDNARFGILGIGWDGMGFLSAGQKLGDVSGRYQVIKAIKIALMKYFECELALGNRIYHDLNGIYFVIPALPDEKEAIPKHSPDIFQSAQKEKTARNYAEFLEQIKDKIREICCIESSKEIFPRFEQVKETAYLSSLVRIITDLRNTQKIPVAGKNLSSYIGQWKDEEKNRSICPICRKRPVVTKKENGKNVEQKVCELCDKRRRGDPDGKRHIEKVLKSGQTPFLSEIADKNGRVALIVCQFGLDRWLDGTMVRSEFVSAPQLMGKEVEQLGCIVDEKFKYEKKIKEYLEKEMGNDECRKYDFKRIGEELSLIFNYSEKTPTEKEMAKNLLFLYDRRSDFPAFWDKNKRDPEKYMISIRQKWQDFLKTARREHDEPSIDDNNLLANIINAKTPTPSTILDVWQSTERFFRSLDDKEGPDAPGDLYTITNGNYYRIKLRLKFENGDNLKDFTIYEAECRGKAFELFKWREDFYALRDPKGVEVEVKPDDKITIKRDEFGESEGVVAEVEDVTPKACKFYPFRTVAYAPDIFMVLVPADRALDVTKHIYGKYQQWFGKVQGRLPFSIANLYFNHKNLPMFVALDAARRMLDNFEKLHKEEKAFQVNAKYIHDKKYCGFELEEKASPRTVSWELPLLLGNNQVDYHHPYMFCEDDKADMRMPGLMRTNQETKLGWLKHFCQIEPGNTLRLYPNYFDFEFLDCTARRFDLAYGVENNRPHKNFLDKHKRRTRPYLMEELEQQLVQLWTILKSDSGLTDSKLKNIQTLLVARLQEWQREDTNLEQFAAFAASVINHEFPNLEKKEFIVDAIKEGRFFDCLELYQDVLKLKIREKENK